MEKIEKLKKHEQVYENFYSKQIVTSMPSEVEVMNKINEVVEAVNHIVCTRPTKSGKRIVRRKLK